MLEKALSCCTSKSDSDTRWSAKMESVKPMEVLHSITVEVLHNKTVEVLHNITVEVLHNITVEVLHNIIDDKSATSEAKSNVKQLNNRILI